MHVPASESGQRLDRFLKNTFPDVPFVAIQKLIRRGQVRVDGKRALPNTRLAAGQLLRLPPNLATPQAPATPASHTLQLTKADKALLQQSILYEDETVLVLNKPAGLATQAGNGITRSLDRLLAALYPANPPKITHRLDRETTGVIVFAKSRQAAASLTAQFAEHQVQKIYYALLTGHLGRVSPQLHHVHAALTKTGSHSRVSPKQAGQGSHPGQESAAKPAHTSYTVLAHHTLGGQPFTLVAATPHTGRTNQLRVHFAYLGHPIAGDGKYGTPASKAAVRALHPTSATPLYLHAHQLTFQHPLTARSCTHKAPLPQVWHAALQSFNFA